MVTGHAEAMKVYRDGVVLLRQHFDWALPRPSGGRVNIPHEPGRAGRGVQLRPVRRERGPLLSGESVYVNPVHDGAARDEPRRSGWWGTAARQSRWTRRFEPAMRPGVLGAFAGPDDTPQLVVAQRVADDQTATSVKPRGMCALSRRGRRTGPARSSRSRISSRGSALG